MMHWRGGHVPVGSHAVPMFIANIFPLIPASRLTYFHINRLPGGSHHVSMPVVCYGVRIYRYA